MTNLPSAAFPTMLRIAGTLGCSAHRLSRSLKDLLHLMEKIEAAGAGFRC